MPRPPIYEDVEFWEIDRITPLPDSVYWAWPRIMVGLWLLMIGGIFISGGAKIEQAFGLMLALIAVNMLRNLGTWIAIASVIYLLIHIAH